MQVGGKPLAQQAQLGHHLTSHLALFQFIAKQVEATSRLQGGIGLFERTHAITLQTRK